MPTPSELVTESFAQANNFANEAKTQLATFTSRLNDAIQIAPLVELSFNAVPEPSAATVAPYVAPGDYSSSILTTLASGILARLAGGTGLAPSVETAIWDRARERELATAQAAIDQVTRDSEALGWQLPPGVLVDSIRREQRAYFDKASGLSREIAIKQADLEQTNMQHAIDKALAYEGTLSEILARRTQVSVEVFKAEVDRFRAEVDQDVKHWEAAMRQYEAQENYILAGQKMNAEIIRGNLSTLADAAKVGAQVYAQLAASAHTTIHATATVSASASNSVGYSYNNTTSTEPGSVTAV